MREEQAYSILFEDDDILVVNKPAGVLTIPDRYDLTLPNLRSIFDDKYGKIFIVHRLDRDTSGIVILAKNADAHKNLSMQFEDLTVKKIYHVVVDGVIHQDDMTIDIPLMPDPRKPGRTIPSARGKESLSMLHVMERYRHFTFASIDLVTGRHHQIRVHLSAVGYPLLVDEFYGNSREFYLSNIKKRFNMKKNDTEKPLISRITMHAFSLTIQHPTTNEEMLFEADYPKDFAAMLQVLRKYGKSR